MAKKHLSVTLLSVFFCVYTYLFIPGHAHAQTAYLLGRVTDITTGAGVSGIGFNVNDYSQGTSEADETDSNGYFSSGYIVNGDSYNITYMYSKTGWDMGNSLRSYTGQQAGGSPNCAPNCNFTVEPTHTGNQYVTVYVDNNGNGIRDAGDTPAPDTVYQYQYQTKWYYDANNNKQMDQWTQEENHQYTDQTSCNAFLADSAKYYFSPAPPAGAVCSSYQAVTATTPVLDYFTYTDMIDGYPSPPYNFNGTQGITNGSDGGSTDINSPWHTDTYTLQGIAPGYKLISPKTQTMKLTNTSPNPVYLDFLLKKLPPTTPWFQTQGGDIRIDPFQPNPIPDATVCGNQPYASVVGSGNTPGIIFSGSSVPTYGANGGSASSFNWSVGDLSTYAEPFTSLRRTSVAYITQNMQSENLTATELSTSNIESKCAKSGNNYLSCDLTGLTGGTIANPAIYKATGDLNLSSVNLTFSTGSYVILVSGTLTINNEIHVTKGQANVTFAATDIVVSPEVGTTATSCSPSSQIEGYYSADNDITLATRADCSAATPVPDNQLTVEGGLVINAGNTGGKIKNKRDLCVNNSSYPSLVVRERPDLTLTTPLVLLQAHNYFNEVAP